MGGFERISRRFDIATATGDSGTMKRLANRCLPLGLLAFLGCAAITQVSAEQSAAHAVDAPGSSSREASTEVMIFLSTDEHGWLSPLHDPESGVGRGGLVPFAHALQRHTRLPAAQVGLFSVGDNWTGPFESTALQGAPMLHAMNLLAYRASVVGNHEFDFGQELLAQRAREAAFPLLAANIVEEDTGVRPSWATPWVIVPLGGIRLGVLGLANRDTPQLTDPRNVVGLSFLDYGPVLRRELPLLKAAGAQHVMLLVHDEASALLPLRGLLREEGIRIVGVGHSHQSVRLVDDGDTPADPRDDIVFCSGGAYLRGYCSVRLRFDDGALAVVDAEVHRVETAGGKTPPDEESDLVRGLEEIVASAGREADALGGQLLAMARARITSRDHALGQYVVDSWLQALPLAQVALTNQGAIRQDIEAGPIRVRDLHSALPFDNTLLLLSVQGRALRSILEHPESLAGGVRYRYRTVDGRRKIVSVQLQDGTPLDDEKVYRVVVTDFMYRGGDGYELSGLDGSPAETGMDWRAPVIHRLQQEAATGHALDVKADDRAMDADSAPR